ncbi:MAG: DUF134 domain-containing protein [Sedimentisphaerales bacterium]|nr:DUF134 domain-containing protein [Sedimentisphaerales bacterium]
MPRPRHCRRVAMLPHVAYYKPRGVPLAALQCVELAVDELEALRLADLEGLYQEEAAQRMNVSRQTFGRIIEAAHKKVADALVHGKALSIEGGPIEVTEPEAGPPGPACRRGGPMGGPHRCRRGGRRRSE